MNPLKNLSVIRKFVQFLSFLFLVYGSSVVGFYAADKLSASLPALACAYDSKTADYCALIVLQHQLDHRVGMVLATGGAVLKALMPTLITLATFFVFMVILSKAFCGWICPLGFFQEIMTLIGQKIGLKSPSSLSDTTVNKLRPMKWFILLGLVFIFPLMTGLGFLGMSSGFGDAFCRICPSRILTTLMIGDPNQLYVDTSSTSLMIWSVMADFLFGLIIAIGLTVRQPFCRICPMLALQTVFKKAGLARLVKNSTEGCSSCGLCAKNCPMDIREIHTQETGDAVHPDCTLCGRCVEFCPRDNQLAIKYAVAPIFTSSKTYCAERTKAQKKWEKGSLIKNTPSLQTES